MPPPALWKKVIKKDGRRRPPHRFHVSGPPLSRQRDPLLYPVNNTLVNIHSSSQMCNIQEIRFSLMRFDSGEAPLEIILRDRITFHSHPNVLLLRVPNAVWVSQGCQSLYHYIGCLVQTQLSITELQHYQKSLPVTVNHEAIRWKQGHVFLKCLSHLSCSSKWSDFHPIRRI